MDFSRGAAFRSCIPWVAMGTAITLAGMTCLRSRSPESSDGYDVASPLVAALLKPESEIHDGQYIVVAPRDEHVRFEYEIRNISNKPVELLPPRVSCNCAVSDVPATFINPGCSTMLALQLTAPTAGTRIERVVIRTREFPDAALEIVSALRSEISPPCIISCPRVVFLRPLPGENAPHEVAIRTIERRGAAHLIETLRATEPHSLEIELLSVIEQPSQDSGCVSRTYLYALGVGNTQKTASKIDVDALTHTGEQVASMRVYVQPVSAVSLVPGYLSFHFTDDNTALSRRVFVMRRKSTDTRSVSVQDFDRELVDVRVVNEDTSLEIFEITTMPGLAKGPQSTRVTFSVGGEEIIELPVNFFFFSRYGSSSN